MLANIDRNGRTILYSYDALHHRTAEYWMDGISLVRSIGYSVDDSGAVLAAGDAQSGYVFTYDDRGRMDPVALDAQLANDFVPGDRIADSSVVNGCRTDLRDGGPHAAIGYLRDAAVRAAVHQ